MWQGSGMRRLANAWPEAIRRLSLFIERVVGRRSD